MIFFAGIPLFYIHCHKFRIVIGQFNVNSSFYTLKNWKKNKTERVYFYFERHSECHSRFCCSRKVNDNWETAKCHKLIMDIFIFGKEGFLQMYQPGLTFSTVASELWWFKSYSSLPKKRTCTPYLILTKFRSYSGLKALSIFLDF